MRESVSLVAWRWHTHFYFSPTVVVLGHYLPSLFQFLKKFLMLSPAHPMHKHWNTSYYHLHSIFFLLSVHCIFKKQVFELKKVDGHAFLFFFFFRYKNFRISTMKNCKKLFTSLYGMNRELSEGDYSDDVYTRSPYWELGWKTFHHDCLQIIFVFEFASAK